MSQFHSELRTATAERDFEFRLLLVEENFRNAGYVILGQSPNDRIDFLGGSFERKYDWSTDGKPVLGLEFSELLNPLTEGLTNSQRIHWNLESEPSLEQIQSSPGQTSGTIVLRAEYRFLNTDSYSTRSNRN